MITIVCKGTTNKLIIQALFDIFYKVGNFWGVNLS